MAAAASGVAHEAASYPGGRHEAASAVGDMRRLQRV